MQNGLALVIIAIAVLAPLAMLILSLGFGVWRPWLWIAGALLLALVALALWAISFASRMGHG